MEQLKCAKCNKEISLKQSNNSLYFGGRICNDCNEKYEIPRRIFETINDINS